MQIDSSLDSLGHITSCNKAFYSVFGVTPKEITHMSINAFVPHAIEEVHDIYMKDFFKSGRQIIFNQERHLYARHKEGYVFRALLYV